MDRLIIILATGLGTGYSPVAPGTAGSLIGLALYWFMSALPHHVYIPTVLAFVFLAAWVSNRACVLFGRKDPSRVTIDEIAGLLVTFVMHPFSWLAVIAGFVLFRIFDIAKPFPLRWIERRFPGGWGVVLDDVAAGVYANVSLWIVMWGLAILGLVNAA